MNVNASPSLRRAARATDAVHVILGLLRHVVVDDVRDAGDVEPALRDVRRDEHAHLAALEILERARALRLRLVGVHRRRVDALALEMPHDAIGAVLGAREHEHRIERRRRAAAARAARSFGRAAPDTPRASPCSRPDDRRPTCTTTGLRRYLRASASTSGGIVALNNSVCRYCGTSATMRLICGAKPMSSMRSASSSTSTSRSSNTTFCRSR